MSQSASINQTSLALELLPDALHEELLNGWHHFCSQATSRQAYRVQNWLSQSPDNVAAFTRACGASQFLRQQLLMHPQNLVDMLDRNSFSNRYGPQEMQQHIQHAVTSSEELGDSLRQLRQQEMCRLIWRFFNRSIDQQEIFSDLSQLAEGCIDVSIKKLYENLAQTMGQPYADGEPATAQHLVVLGMGKLGGGELNLSSDIDLIFAYPLEGETRHGKRSYSNREFFLRLVQQLVGLLSEYTARGFVFRVDTRLRPFGNSGALIHCFEALEHYYMIHGRGWERYALIKARPVGGDRGAGQELLALLNPFIYRRYMDFGVLESLREMKQQVVQSASLKSQSLHIKNGPGGIREAEFTVQTLQILHGGRDLSLQQSSFSSALENIAQFGYLSGDEVNELSGAYHFLRDTEHALQGYADEQLHTLPEDAKRRASLIVAMGCDNWSSFEEQLQHHQNTVRECFNRLFITPSSNTEKQDNPWQLIWHASAEEQEKFFHNHGFGDGEEATKLLQDLLSSRHYQIIQSEASQRLELFMPLLLAHLATTADPLEGMRCMIPLVSVVLQRSAYLSLLIEQSHCLALLVDLCTASPWIAQLIVTNPVLIDDLLSLRNDFTPDLDRPALRHDLHRQLNFIDWHDLENQMERLRNFKISEVLKVASWDVHHKIPLMKVSDALSYTAETILERSMQLAWFELVQKHGYPLQADGTATDELDFVIIAYGKLGGLELSYGSDLDLVFLYHCEDHQSTNGASPLSNAHFFLRMVQRLLHILQTRTLLGPLYEIDTRLRPDGASGSLVRRLEAYRAYQLHDASTWEHQALVRARAVCGSSILKIAFDNLRRDILCQQRDLGVLATEVQSMRQRMGEEVQPGNDPVHQALHHLKISPGGILDIEFMVQYAVLAHAANHPAITLHTDNIRILELMAGEHLIKPEEAKEIADIYRVYRQVVHDTVLYQQYQDTGKQALATYGHRISHYWQQWLQG